MGWSQQGYNGENHYWEVQGYTRGLNPEIENYHRRRLELDDYPNTRIIYGTTGEEYFRGYVFTDDENIVKEVLSKFEGFLVYSSKYGDSFHAFSLKNMTFYNFEEITLFLERRIFWDFEWDEFKNNLEWSLDADNVSEETKNRVLKMKIPIDYLEAREKIENQISAIGIENSELIKHILNSIKRKDLQIEMKEKYE